MKIINALVFIFLNAIMHTITISPLTRLDQFGNIRELGVFNTFWMALYDNVKSVQWVCQI